MKISIQRLRNLTTGKLHTKIDHIYEDLGTITGECGLFTHMLPNVRRSVLPWLESRVTDPKFWDNKYDPEHTGDDLELADPTVEERAAMFERYKALPSLLEGKNVVVVNVGDQGE